MVVRFLRPAEDEVAEAIAYLDAQRNGLADRFERALQDALTLIEARPRAGKLVANDLRSFPLQTFHYDLIYAHTPDEIVIVAVAHHRREPAYWKYRINDR